MTTTTRHIQGAELPRSLRTKFNVKPDQFLKITIEVEDMDDEYDTVNVGDEIIEGLKEIIAHKKGELDFPPPL